MTTMEDVKRLAKVVKILSSLDSVFYHMDAHEYEITKDYIYGRFGVTLAFKNPTIKSADSQADTNE